MASVKVYELARELEVDSRDLIRELADLGHLVKSASSPVAPEEVQRLRDRGKLTIAGTGMEAAGRSAADAEYGQCPCCFRDDMELLPPKTPDHLPADRDRYICRPCTHHSQPNEARETQRNRSHAVMYSQDAQKEVGARQDSFDKELGRLRKELEDRPVVEHSLDEEVLDEARLQTRSALRSRDHAYGELLAIRLLHRQNPGSTCSCGLDNCPTARRFFETPSGLNRWETEQVERLRKKQRNYLPDNHPAVLDPRRAIGWGSR